MPQSLSEERIPARMPTAVYERLVEAAQLVGSTLNQFLVQASLKSRADYLARAGNYPVKNCGSNCL